MKPIKHWLSPFIARLRASDFEIKRFQGNPKATVLLLAPPPGEEEVKENLAWCGPSARVFFELMQAQVPLTPNQFLILPAAFRKQTTKMFRSSDADFGRTVVKAAAESDQIKAFVCVGGEAFKAYIGYGKNPSMDMLAGTVLQVAQTNMKPLLVFPDMTPLLFNERAARVSRTPNREIGQALAAQRSLLKMLEQREMFEKTLKLCQL